MLGLSVPSWTMKVVLDVLLLVVVPALLLGWHLDLRRTRAERSSALNKDAAGGPQIPSEHTLLGEGRAGLGANCSGGRLDSVIFLSNVVLLAFLSIVNGRADRFGRRGDQRV